ncbi:hypothetical protein JCM10908_007164 [Rhodotorula pacifica]|uniref:uncharacterized protein n=1 Tax=Rhodotorula pacifica TaxID=1495444 RepID=UPI003180B10B
MRYVHIFVSALVACIFGLSSIPFAVAATTAPARRAATGPRRLDRVNLVPGPDHAQTVDTKAFKRTGNQGTQSEALKRKDAVLSDSREPTIGELVNIVQATTDEHAGSAHKAISHDAVDTKISASLSHSGNSAAPQEQIALSSKKRHKRCHYIGTFFRRIDCNAPANSTSIPYSHAPLASPSASESL